jgi:hypothetical protein
MTGEAAPTPEGIEGVEAVLAGDRSQERFVMRDLMDLQLVACDGRRVGRVDDVQAEILPDGRLVIRGFVTGPQALAGRVYPRLRRVLRWFLRDRFENEIPITEVTSFGPTIRLRGPAEDYPLGRSDHALAERILRRIPGADR